MGDCLLEILRNAACFTAAGGLILYVTLGDLVLHTRKDTSKTFESITIHQTPENLAIAYSIGPFATMAAGKEILDCLREPSEEEEETFKAAQLAQTARREARAHGHEDATADVIDALEAAEAAYTLTGVKYRSSSLWTAFDYSCYNLNF